VAAQIEPTQGREGAATAMETEVRPGLRRELGISSAHGSFIGVSSAMGRRCLRRPAAMEEQRALAWAFTGHGYGRAREGGRCAGRRMGERRAPAPAARDTGRKKVGVELLAGVLRRGE
jgi:hypothetical protein